MNFETKKLNWRPPGKNGLSDDFDDSFVRVIGFSFIPNICKIDNKVEERKGEKERWKKHSADQRIRTLNRERERGRRAQRSEGDLWLARLSCQNINVTAKIITQPRPKAGVFFCVFFFSSCRANDWFVASASSYWLVRGLMTCSNFLNFLNFSHPLFNGVFDCRPSLFSIE